MMQPLVLLLADKKFDINVKVNGGGFSGQAGAIRLAIANVLVKVNGDDKKILKLKKLTTRDKRVKERKKYGKYGARRSPQFTKR
jgi:small subunit ribosomal protein S9